MKTQNSPSTQLDAAAIASEHSETNLTIIHGLLAATLVVGLYILAELNYLAFHILAEMFSIIVAAALFLIVWHGQRFIANSSLVALGIAFFFAGFIDLVHTLTYKGMGVFQPEDQVNAATQLWIAARWMESLSFFAFIWLLGKPLRAVIVLWGYAGVTGLLLWTIFGAGIFPDCYFDGSGLTAFKIGSEYAICVVLSCALVILSRRKQELDPAVRRMLSLGIQAAIVSELAFTFYISVYGLSNFIGHVFKIVSFYLIYLALVRSSFTRPYQTLFRELTATRQVLQRRLTELDTVMEATADGILAVDENGKVLHSNERFRQLLGIPEDLLKSGGDGTLIRFVHDQLKDPHTFEARVKALYGSTEEEFAILEFKDGRVFEQFSSPLIQSGRASGRVWSFRDVTERRLAEEALKQSERRFRALTEKATEFINILDDKGTITYNMAGSNNSLGYTAEEMVGRSAFELVHPEDLPRVLELFRESIPQPGKIEHAEVRIRAKDGSWRWQSAVGTNLLNDPAVCGILINSRDITERKRAEEVLRESESFFRQALESIPGMVFTTRPDGYCDYQSQQWVDYTGVPMSEHLGSGWNRLLHPEDRRRAFAAWQDAVQGLAPYDLEYRVRRYDGVYEWFKVIGRPIRDTSGEVARWFGVAMNIEQLKQAEQALRTSEARFRSLAESNIIGVVVADPVTGQVFDANDEYLRIIGRSRSELLAGAVNWRSSTQPEELAREDALPHNRQHEGRMEAFDKTYILPDGTRVPVIIGGSFLPDDPGKVIAFVLDMTARKRVEDALRQSEERLRLFIEHAPASLAMFDHKMRYLSVSRRWLTDYKLGERDLVGLSHYEVFPEIPEYWKAAHRRALTGEVVQAEADRFEREDGSEHWLRWETRPWRDQTGDIAGIVIFSEDITQRKKAEEALRQLNETLEQRVAERTALAEARSRQLQALAVELIEAEERERRRIADLLHNDLQQILAAARMQLESVSQSLPPESMVSNVEVLLSEAIAKARRMSHEISPPVLLHSDLLAALRWQAGRMMERFGLHVELEMNPAQPCDKLSLKTFLFHAVQELLFNVVKHAEVKTAWLSLTFQDSYLILTVSDQGKGFSPDILNSLTIRSGFGLLSLRERCNYIGGSLVIESAPGHGSCFTLTVPVGIARVDELETTDPVTHQIPVSGDGGH